MKNQIIIVLISFAVHIKSADDQAKKACFTDLMKACVYNHTQVSSLLTNKADISVKDNNGKTALHWAAQHGRKEAVEVIRLLVDNKADINDQAKNGQTPLMCALHSGFPREITALLLELKACPSNVAPHLETTFLDRNHKEVLLQILQPEESKSAKP